MGPFYAPRGGPPIGAGWDKIVTMRPTRAVALVTLALLASGAATSIRHLSGTDVRFVVDYPLLRFAERTGASWVREAEWDETAISESLIRTLRSADAWTAAASRMRAADHADAAMAVAVACERLVAGRRSDLEPLTAAPRGSAKR